jgi:hypothetical protein
MLAEGGGEQLRFFEKKKQKTFVHLAAACPEGLSPGFKSFRPYCRTCWPKRWPSPEQALQ